MQPNIWQEFSVSDTSSGSNIIITCEGVVDGRLREAVIVEKPDGVAAAALASRFEVKGALA
jgi:hypothetical protein